MWKVYICGRVQVYMGKGMGCMRYARHKSEKQGKAESCSRR